MRRPYKSARVKSTAELFVPSPRGDRGGGIPGVLQRVVIIVRPSPLGTLNGCGAYEASSSPTARTRLSSPIRERNSRNLRRSTRFCDGFCRPVGTHSHNIDGHLNPLSWREYVVGERYSLTPSPRATACDQVICQDDECDEQQQVDEKAANVEDNETEQL